VLRDVLELIEKSDPEHYAGMMRIVAPAEMAGDDE
jgi:hypothetical protein